MDFANNYNGTILLVDLDTGETSNESLDEALVEESLEEQRSTSSCTRSMPTATR